jgi:hypothetical protein
MNRETYEIAHINEQGQNMIIIPISPSIHTKTQAQKNALLNSLQYFARDAGLAGSVCLVWQVNRRLYSLGPHQWSRFLTSIDMNFVSRNINKKLTCRT